MSVDPQEVKNPLQVQIVAVAAASSNLVYIIVALMLRHTGSMPENGFVALNPEIAGILGPAFVLVGLGSLFFATFLRRFMTARLTSETDTLQERLRITVISGALLNSAGTTGLVLVLLAGFSNTAWLLWGISLCGDILIFPTRAWLEFSPHE
jgi:hypothetical protein